MNKTTIAIIAAILLAVYGGVSVLTGKKDASPPPVISTPVEPAPVEPEPVEPPSDLPTDPAEKINHCNAVIEKYKRLKFEKDVLGNDYITPRLERQYRECT